MGVVIVDTLQRGGTGESPFPLIDEADVKISYLTVAAEADRLAIPEWKRAAGTRVHQLSDGTDWRLGVDVTIAGQVWTEVTSSTAFQLLAEKNNAGGYVGLESDGFISPQYIKSIFSSNSFVVADAAARYAETTVTGDIVVQTDTAETWVKLNNNAAPTVDGDFALLSVAASILSVNGNVGVVTIDFSSMIAQAGSQAAFETAVGLTPSVSGNTSQIVNNTNDIAAIYAILTGLGTATEINIPLYNSGESYEDGDNVIYGTENSRSLYRVKETKGPLLGTLPTDETVWERVGDFYTQDEVDALLLNLTSEPDFNWNRPINKLPQIGEIPGSTKLIDGLEEVFYGRIDATAEIVSIDTLEVGASIAPTINGIVTLGDGVNIQQITILDDTGTEVGNPTFVGTDAINEFSFQVDTAILITAGNILKYSIKVDVNYDSLLPLEILTSDTVVISAVYPILFGTGAADLNITDKYIILQPLIELDGNKTVTVNSNSNKIYFCIPIEYADRVGIIEDSGDDLFNSLFSSPVTESVTSNGLNTDWTHSYKVYQSNYNTDSSDIELTFILNRADALNTGDNTLDEIEEGAINKHLTKALKEKLTQFNGGDYLTKAGYDTDDNGVVEFAAQRATNGSNVSGASIANLKLVHITGADPVEEVLNIELADAGSNKPCNAITLEAIGIGSIGKILLLGFAVPINLPGGAIGDLVYLDGLGSMQLLPPASGLIQSIGTIFAIDGGNDALIHFSPQNLDARSDFIRNWRSFTPYEKDAQLVVSSTLIPNAENGFNLIVRVVNEGYTSTNDVTVDYVGGDLEVIGGDMHSLQYDPNQKYTNVFDMDSMDDGLTEADPAVRKVTITENQRIKLDALEQPTFKGIFATPTTLRAAHDNTGGLVLDGYSANVVSTATTWIWDSNATPTAPTVGGDWVDSLAGIGGDMLASTYDPAGKGTKVYDTDQHEDGTTNKVYSALDKTKLGTIEDNATADQTALEIKTAYESNLDTNEFLDAEKTKLTNIEDDAKDDQNSAEVPYDNTTSALTATDVKGAIDEIDNLLDTLPAFYLDKAVYDINENGISDKAESIVNEAFNDEVGTITAGTVVYFNRADVTGKFFKVADRTVAASIPTAGFLLADTATGVAGTIISSGVFQITSFIAAVAGDNLYLSTTGLVTVASPTVEEASEFVLIARVIGVVTGALIIEMFNQQRPKALEISFDPSTSILTETDIQLAIAKLAARSVRVMGTLDFRNAIGSAQIVGEILLPSSISSYSPNTTVTDDGQLISDIASDVMVTISVDAQLIGNNDIAEYEIAINGILTGYIGGHARGNTEYRSTVSISAVMQLAAGDYISVFLSGVAVTVYGMQITINGNQT